MRGPSFIDFLKQKVVANRVLDLHRSNGSLTRGPSKIHAMFSSHFQSIISTYHLMDGVITTWDACCRVVPCKVSSGDRDLI
jgi:hypothetical protein